MKKCCLLAFIGFQLFSAQNITDILAQRTHALLAADNMKAAHLSFYVADSEGNLVYEYQGDKGLATASTQKIFTAIAALETLGSNYKYKTQVSYDGKIENGILQGDLYLTSNGDPSLGSWRYAGFKPEDFKAKLLTAIERQNIKTITGNIIIDDTYFDMQTTPGSWPWNDIGNYYGAGVWGVNWHENQFDIIIQNATRIKGFNYQPVGVTWYNQVQPGGRGDNSIIYTAPFSKVAIIDGHLPRNQTMTISGAMPNPPLQLGHSIKQWLTQQGIVVKGNVTTANLARLNQSHVKPFPKEKTFFTYLSPSLDKLVYWFLHKSINLYGETFIKTFAAESGQSTSFATGVSLLKAFWENKDIPSAMINFKDGSGLSPQNYVAAKAEVMALLYAQKQAYFKSFYTALPTLNGTKMKSGTINSCKAYTGYQRSKNGKTYVFSMIINNYEGGNIRAQMYHVLNALK